MLAVLAGFLPALVSATHVSEQQDAAASRSPNPGESSLSVLESLGNTLFGGGEPAFLDPDVAYVMSTRVPDPSTVVVRFDIADEYYLYRDKFTFDLKGSTAVELAGSELPAGEEKVDEFFGRMRVFYGEVEARLALVRGSPGPAETVLEVGYQGCADAGLCYPPMTKTVALTLPAASESASDESLSSGTQSNVSAGPLSASGTLPEQDRIARSLATGRIPLVLLAFFGFGLLLTFTPCVFPMLPILSSIIVGQGEGLTTRRAFALSLTYVLAMAATYTMAGVVAGLFGANLQAAFQDPWVLGAFSLVFVLLALSMFGFYDLQVPAAWRAKLSELSHRQRGGTYIGVGIMGFLSALIVGPCVAAPLAGALIYIGQSGDAVLGGTALFALSMGMGTPVLALGTSAGKLLPKAVPWLGAVKAVFGVLLIAVAIYLIERIVPGWVAMTLWGLLLIVSAIYMGALDTLGPGTSGWRRLWKGTGFAMMVYGVLLMVGAAGGADDPLRPLRGLSFVASGEQARKLEFKRVKGVEGLEAELRLAVAAGRPVMLDYYADWCVSCKELERYTFSDAGVQAALGDAVLLQTDVTANDEADRALLEHFGLFGPPAILFFGPDGKERPQFRVVGFMDAERFRAHVRKAFG